MLNDRGKREKGGSPRKNQGTWNFHSSKAKKQQHQDQVDSLAFLSIPINSIVLTQDFLKRNFSDRARKRLVKARKTRKTQEYPR